MTFRKTADTLPKGAHTLKRNYYVNPDILKIEYENIFLNEWICAGHSSEFKESGQFKVMNIGNENIIILRDDNGDMRAHFNICRHRGTRICESSSGQFSKSIQCGYHGWTYNLKGKLIGAPHMDGVSSFKMNDYSLHPVSVLDWEGFVFVNLSEKPDPLHKVINALGKRLKPWMMDKLEIKKTIEYEVKGNWKLVIQNYSECYHCPILHPQLAEIHHYLGGRNDFHSGPVLGGFMDFNKNKKTISSSGEFCCPPFKNIKGKDRSRVYYYSIFPNMMLSLHPEYVMVHTVSPMGVNQCKVNCSWLFTKEIVLSDKYNTKDAIRFWDKTNKQDWKITELSQLGIQSKKYSPAPYSGQESLLAAFDKYYLDRLKFKD